MNLSEITHRGIFTDCFPVNEREIRINLRAGKDVDAVNIIHDDPYLAGIPTGYAWTGKKESMSLLYELKYHNIWSIVLKPEFKREQYYFELHSKTEKLYLLEDDFYREEELNVPEKMYSYFKYPWLNASDVCVVPKWVSDTIWYQIFPDRFCKGGNKEKRMRIKPWKCEDNITPRDFYGGDIKGILKRLDYLKDLGISGIYLTPVFLSNSNHKYNTADYAKVDPDFGEEKELLELIDAAHERGIRIMLDAVFNHCGTDFIPWQDVVKNGEKSPYFSWFCINKWPVDGKVSTKDGRYFSFAFEAGMPKLNTNHPEVVNYFVELCSHWIKDWKIDGIRFDVGNEIAHSFLKKLRYELKAINPNVFLLGEIWHDSAQWLQGDEYDSVMNYPFLEGIHNFWVDKEKSAKDFMYQINYCYSLYQDPVNRVIFNFLDTHDIGRACTRCGSLERFLQQFVVLMSLQGSPCLYYGTEIGMTGKDDPDNRRCMPWEAIDAGKYDNVVERIKAIISLRNQYPQMKSPEIVWIYEEREPRLIHYRKKKEDLPDEIEIYINVQDKESQIKGKKEVLFSENYEEGVLKPDGILICKKKHNL